MGVCCWNNFSSIKRLVNYSCGLVWVKKVWRVFRPYVPVASFVHLLIKRHIKERKHASSCSPGRSITLNIRHATHSQAVLASLRSLYIYIYWFSLMHLNDLSLLSGLHKVLTVPYARHEILRIWKNKERCMKFVKVYIRKILLLFRNGTIYCAGRLKDIGILKLWNIR